MQLVDGTAVAVLEGYRVVLTFSDGIGRSKPGALPERPCV